VSSRLLRRIPWIAPLALAFAAPVLAQAPRTPSPEDRALAYLAAEVPRWSAENKCYSCHNNGDAARALFAGLRAGRKVPAKATEDTAALASPAKWDDNGGDPASATKTSLACSSLTRSSGRLDAGLLKEKESWQKAAELVAEHQGKDGSWQIDADGPGTPPPTAPHWRRSPSPHPAPRGRRQVPRRHYPRRPLASGVAQKSVGESAVLLQVLAGSQDDVAVKRRRSVWICSRRDRARTAAGAMRAIAIGVFDTALVVLSLKEAGGEDGRRCCGADRRTCWPTGEGRKLARDGADEWGEQLRTKTVHNWLGDARAAGHVREPLRSPSLPPQDGCDHMTGSDVRPRPAQVREGGGLVGPGLLEGVGEDGQPLGVSASETGSRSSWITGRVCGSHHCGRARREQGQRGQAGLRKMHRNGALWASISASRPSPCLQPCGSIRGIGTLGAPPSGDGGDVHRHFPRA
jgi:hypothetical protein